MNFENWQQEISSEYPSGVDFGSEILSPQISEGFEVQVVGNFVPSYIFETVSSLVNSMEEIEGYLNLWLLLPRKFVDRPDAIALLVELIHKSSSSRAEALEFIENCLLLIENKALGFNVGFYKSDPPKSPLTQGVVFDREDLSDFWSFSDNKPKTPASTIRVFRTWENDEFVDARGVFQKVLGIANDADSRIDMYKGGEVIGWLGYASDWQVGIDWEEFEQEAEQAEISSNPEYVSDAGSLETDEDDIEKIIFSEDVEPHSSFDLLERTDFAVYESVKLYLSDLEEFQSEDRYVYLDEDEAAGIEHIDFCDRVFGRVPVEYDDFADMHHLPPVFNQMERDNLAMKTAICICGTLIIRIHGCHDVMW